MRLPRGKLHSVLTEIDLLAAVPDVSLEAAGPGRQVKLIGEALNSADSAGGAENRSGRHLQ